MKILLGDTLPRLIVHTWAVFSQAGLGKMSERTWRGELAQQPKMAVRKHGWSSGAQDGRPKESGLQNKLTKKCEDPNQITMKVQSLFHE